MEKYIDLTLGIKQVIIQAILKKFPQKILNPSCPFTYTFYIMHIVSTKSLKNTQGHQGLRPPFLSWISSILAFDESSTTKVARSS